jgi:two-component system sensor histidine kinase FlrB
MAAALAHQIRTPLSAALLYTENAARPGLTDTKRESQLAKAARCLHDLEKLIADMLGFARGAGAAQTPLSISDLLDGLSTALSAVTDSGQQVSIGDGPANCQIAGNREALSGALLNLAMNALQHGGPNARVAVDVTVRGTRLEIRVRDNGPGVPREYRERIFEPFFTSRPDGTGLGLAVVRSVARAHGGDVVLETGSDTGACFVVHLPLASAVSQATPGNLAEVAA